MKKNGFTIVEIITTIFILTLSSMVMIHFIAKGTRTQADNIYKWITFYKEVNSQYKVYLFQNKEKDKFSQTQNVTFKTLYPYLNLQNAPKVTKYKFRYLNGKIVTDNTEDYFKDFAYRKDGSIVGFKIIDKNCYANRPCASLLMDTNGEEKPNKLGIDIFGLNFYKTEIHPWGYFDYNESLDYKKNCSKKGTGITCSHYYLIGGKFY